VWERDPNVIGEFLVVFRDAITRANEDPVGALVGIVTAYATRESPALNNDESLGKRGIGTLDLEENRHFEKAAS